MSTVCLGGAQRAEPLARAGGKARAARVKDAAAVAEVVARAVESSERLGRSSAAWHAASAFHESFLVAYSEEACRPPTVTLGPQKQLENRVDP